MQNLSGLKRVYLSLLFGFILAVYGCGGGGGGGGADSTTVDIEAELVTEAYGIFRDSYFDPPRIHEPSAADTLKSYVISYKSYDHDIYTEYYDVDQMNEVNEYLSSNEETIVKSSGTVLYIAFNRFATGTADRIIQIIEYGIYNKYDCLILDLRLNGGGLVVEAADLLEYFLGSQNSAVLLGIVEKRGIISPRFLATSSYREMSFDAGNMYILTSGGTASATEILVAGLVYYNEATQLGTTTFGKNRLVGFYTTSRGDGYEWTNGIVYHADGVDREGLGITPSLYTTDPIGYLFPGYIDPLIEESWITADNLPLMNDRDSLRYQTYMAALAGLRVPVDGLILWKLE